MRGLTEGGAGDVGAGDVPGARAAPGAATPGAPPGAGGWGGSRVAERIAWFYAVHPRGRIVTDLVTRAREVAVFRAAVYRSDGDTAPAATGWSAGNPAGGAAIERVEEAAVGRALANLGFAAAPRATERGDVAAGGEPRAAGVRADGPPAEGSPTRELAPDVPTAVGSGAGGRADGTPGAGEAASGAPGTSNRDAPAADAPARPAGGAEGEAAVSAAARGGLALVRPSAAPNGKTARPAEAAEPAASRATAPGRAGATDAGERRRRLLAADLAPLIASAVRHGLRARRAEAWRARLRAGVDAPEVLQAAEQRLRAWVDRRRAEPYGGAV